MEYDEDFLNQINENVDLLEYVEQSIELKRQGKDFFGHCPLHVDFTPSFSINPDVNKFYCFSCHRGGGIIQYLRNYEHLKFNKAVEKASKLANLDIKMMCQSKTVQYNRKLKKEKLMLQKENYVHPILPLSELGKYRIGTIDEWLNEGIRQEEIDLFQIRIDDKANRIVYPVYDSEGNLINIKGRTRFPEYKKIGISKYINYYPVGIVDYFQGANITEQYIEETGEIKIFESIKSVMKLFGNGIKDAVSAEKHNLTDEQIKWIISRNYIKNVVLCWDSDVSYQNGDVSRNIAMLKRFVNVFIIEDKNELLGGAAAKNSPIDMGIEVWNQLYEERRKIR